MSVTKEELLEIILDLELEEEIPIFVPEDEPQPGSIYPDALDPKKPLGYSSLPKDIQVLALDRRKYPTQSEAWRMFCYLMELRNLRQYDNEVYWTRRYWFFRVMK